MKKIEVFIRHCFYSKIQEEPSRKRPVWWNKEKVFNNFLKTINPDTTNYTIIYDEFYGKIKDTFLKNENNVEVISCGKESDSFIKTLDLVLSKNFNDDTIIYFLEDDYLHRPNWDQILLEGFSLPVSYVTLYDHRDKYTEMYSDFMSKILITDSSHWKPIPSTTNTFATRIETLKKDILIHKKYSTGFEPTLDHQKFLELNSNGKYLISCIPGYSTHCHSDFLSPCIDWEKYL